MMRLFSMVNRPSMMLRREARQVAASAVVHALVLVALLGSWHFRSVVISPRHRPGVVSGTQLTLAYSPGGAPPAAATALRAPKSSPLPSPLKASKAPSTPSSASPAAPGSGTSGESSLGDGDISIALVRTHPRPAPDLSSLAHGAGGDVVLDVVIDAEGKIASATLEHGLGGAIDQTVLATVQQQWTFAPATKNGVAIASEQELLFHYERG